MSSFTLTKQLLVALHIKILTNRLVGVLGDIVNEVQSAFISERQILDGPFILNEIMQWCRRRKKQSLIFKVDFEKAYDSVRWDFLDDILVKFGFGIKWRGWIQNCLNSSNGFLNWKLKTLSNGEDGSTPIFHMSIYKVPSSVLHLLESIRSH
ncbi:RNA-directed DNA polymerase, eukaryota, reverse transcriptase zinc-binding domain protein, partial [Tanacetum coccineum]